MPALVIESFPEALHARLQQTAAAHHRTVTQETIRLIEQALATEPAALPLPVKAGYWANRKLLPEYPALLESGALAHGTDSTIGLSEERDAR